MFVTIEEKKKWKPTSFYPAVGIDFGTTYCVVALYHQTSLVLEACGRRLIPSVVIQNGKTFSSFKCRLGHETEALPLAVSLFQQIAEHIKKALGYPATAAVVTVPAYFDDVQRTAVKEAAQKAGFHVLRLLAEPTAAALAYGLQKKEEGLYGVYDLGGGTFDFSLIKMEKEFFQVLATGGDDQLGGDDIDAAIALDQSISCKKAQRLKEEICQGKNSVSLLQDRLALLMQPFIDQTLSICQQTLQEAGYMPSQLKGVLLVGGSTLSPFVRKKVADFFQTDPLQSMHPQEVVSIGAALQAHNLTQEASFLLLDATPLSLGIEIFGGLNEKLIPRHSPLPASASYMFTTAETGQTKISVHIVQGEREMAADCRSLGHFHIDGIPPLPKGKARVQITFLLNTDGLLSVCAKEETTGQETLHIMHPHAGLTDHLLKEAPYGQESESGEDIIDRLWIQKRQQVEDALKESRRLMAEYPLLFSCEEKNIWQKECWVLESLLEKKDYISLSDAFNNFSYHVLLSFVERYISHILRERLS